MRRRDGLSYKLGWLFAVFLFTTLLLGGVILYFNQLNVYRRQYISEIRNIASNLAGLVEADGEDFRQYAEYYEEHYADVDIPIDADEYLSWQTSYEKLFQEHHPGKTIGVDITFDELDQEVKDAWFIYTHLYWLLTFEKSRKAFHLDYTYFLLPDEEKHNVVYMIDGERTSRAGHLKFIEENPRYKEFHHEQGNEEEFMYLSDEYHNDPDTYAVLWKTWETGETQPGYVVWHNGWGDDYSCYVPVIIDGEKIGLAVAEIDINIVNSAIFKNTLWQLAIIGAVLIICFLSLEYIINRRYISRIIQLEAGVQHYAINRDVSVTNTIKKTIRGRDEISSLSEGIIFMITKIENYISNLKLMNIELDQTKDTAEKMRNLAHVDALTGIRNRTAYEKELERLKEEVAESSGADGALHFSMAMIDLNGLKQINDTYGHESGNEAIRNLCHIVCDVFKHSPVFRIGGDEFLVILQNEDYRNRYDLISTFNDRIAALKADSNLQPWDKVTAAIGLAEYDKDTDDDIEMVFKRADAAMYKCKTDMNAGR